MVYGQIYGLMVRFLGGGRDVVMVVAVFFLSSRSGFLGWFNCLCSFGGGLGVVGGGFCSFGGGL